MYKADSEARRLLGVPYRQVVRMKVETTDTTLNLSESDVVQGSFAIDRYSVTGEKVELGTATAAQLSVTLKNDDGKFSDVNFEGAVIYAEVGVKKWDAHRWEEACIHWIPCGYFIVDTPPRALKTIRLEALDRMVLFSREVQDGELSFPMTVEELINKCCAVCGVACATDLTGLVNRGYTIGSRPETSEALTYRELIGWCAALTGTCALMNWDGQLVLKWYEMTDVTITPSERYESDLLENDIALTGLVFDADDEDGTEYTAGEAGYALDLSGNGLLQDECQSALDALWGKLEGFCYRPYEAKVKALPYVWPMDRISYTDSAGAVHDTIVSHVTFGLNGATSLAGVGLTAQSESYAVGSLTANQAKILQTMKRETDRTITEREQAVLALNELIANSLGLRCTTADDGSGGTIVYFHDGETLGESTIIYTMTANGFAWTDNWNNGDPTWQYGFTKDGNAVFNALSAYKVTAEYIDAHAITADKLSTEYVTQVETAIGDAADSAEKNANAATDEKLKGYATTEQVTAIQQDADSIKLSVTTNRTELEEQITTVKTEAAEDAASKADAAKTAAVDAANENTAEVLKSYSTTEQMNSAIALSEKGITQTVQDTYATKESLAKRVVGGANLLLGTARMENAAVDCAAASSDKLGTVAYSNAMCEVTNTDQNTRFWFDAASGSVLRVGVTYCMSVMLKLADGTDDLRLKMRSALSSGTLTSYEVKPENCTDIAQNDGWVLRYFGFRLTEDVTLKGLYLCSCADGATVTNHYYLSHPMIQQGTVPSAWEPSDKDPEAYTDEKLSAYTTTVDMNSAIEQSAKSIKQSVSETYRTETQVTDAITGALESYSTTEEMNSAIELSAKDITSTVSKTYATTDSVNKRMAGGDNLLLKTADASAWGVNENTEYRTITTDGELLTLDQTVTGQTFKLVLLPDTSAQLKKGVSYCFSFLYKLVSGTDNTDVVISYRYKSGTNTYTAVTKSLSTAAATDIVQANGWVLRYWTFTPSYDGPLWNSTSSGSSNLTMVKTTGIAEYYLMRPCLQQGTVPSAWTSASGDYLTAEETSTKITQTAEDLTVEINTAKQTATNYLNFSADGLVVGDMTAEALGNNVQIGAEAVDIRQGDTVLARYAADKVELGKNSSAATVDLLNGQGEIAYADNRLTVAAAQKMRLSSKAKAGGGYAVVLLGREDDDAVTIEYDGVSGSEGRAAVTIRAHELVLDAGSIDAKCSKTNPSANPMWGSLNKVPTTSSGSYGKLYGVNGTAYGYATGFGLCYVKVCVNVTASVDHNDNSGVKEIGSGLPKPLHGAVYFAASGLNQAQTGPVGAVLYIDANGGIGVDNAGGIGTVYGSAVYPYNMTT